MINKKMESVKFRTSRSPAAMLMNKPWQIGGKDYMLRI